MELRNDTLHDVAREFGPLTLLFGLLCWGVMTQLPCFLWLFARDRDHACAALHI